MLQRLPPSCIHLHSLVMSFCFLSILLHNSLHMKFANSKLRRFQCLSSPPKLFLCLTAREAAHGKTRDVPFHQLQTKFCRIWSQERLIVYIGKTKIDGISSAIHFENLSSTIFSLLLLQTSLHDGEQVLFVRSGVGRNTPGEQNN